MWNRQDPYEARTEAERQRNLTRLGTRWQEKPRPPQTKEAERWEGAMDVWRAEAAYDAQTLLWVLGLVGLPLALLVLLALLEGCQDVARQVNLMTGCDPVALDRGYCHLPKEAPKL